MYILETEKYTTLVWIVCRRSKSGSVEFYEESKMVFGKRYMEETPWYDTIQLNPYTSYGIFCDSIDIRFAYLCGNQDVLEHGICFLIFENGVITKYNSSNIADAYGQKYRNAFHFSTFKNWMNDPNGLCHHGRYYHLFYQMNPVSLQWGNMYWGHAISEDLLHWRHLPIALFPQKELYGLMNYKGGAYSGSALSDTDGIHLYFTRHFSPWKKGIETKEVQVQAICRDGIKVEDERVIISEKPGGIHDLNFRDPKAVLIDGKKYLLVATTVNGTSTVEKYKQVGEQWIDDGVFFQDDIECDTIECANMIQGNQDSCALLCSLQNAVDHFGRKRLMRYYVGKLEAGIFTADSSDIYDFGTECFALQTFDVGERTLAFGWVLSAYEEFTEEGNVSNGCMTIPRELWVKNGVLYTMPAKEIYELLYHKVKIIQDGTVLNKVPKLFNQYHLDIALKEHTDFKIILVQNSTNHLGLQYDGKCIEILYGKKDKQSEVSLFQPINKLTNIEIFVDKSVIEIFVNKGEYVGTKTYFFEPESNSLQYDFERRQAVQQLEVAKIRSIWKNTKTQEEII